MPAALHACDAQLHGAGLLEDNEVTQMETLVEHKLKHIYFFPPYIAGSLPAETLQSLPAFSDVPQQDFSSQVGSRHHLFVSTIHATRLSVSMLALISEAACWTFALLSKQIELR